MRAVSIASSKNIGGIIVGMRLANMVLPAPGGPISSMFWLPAQETPNARLATSAREHPSSPRNILAGFCQHLRSVHSDRRVHHVYRLRQRFHCKHFNILDHGRFPRVRFRHYHVLDPAISRRQSGGKCAAHGAIAAIERKFPEKDMRVEHLSEKRTLATDQAKRHRQIKRRTFFPNVSRSEIYSDCLVRRKIRSTISQRRLYSLAAFFNRDIGQTDHIKISLVARPDVRLDFHEYQCQTLRR